MQCLNRHDKDWNTIEYLNNYKENKLKQQPCMNNGTTDIESLEMKPKEKVQKFHVRKQEKQKKCSVCFHVNWN